MSFNRNSRPALVKNTSNRFLTFSADASEGPRIKSKVYDLAIPFKMKKGQTIEIPQKHFISMRPFLESLEKRGLIQIIRPCDAEVFSFPENTDRNLGINQPPPPLPLQESVMKWPQRPSDPGPDEIKDGMAWLVDDGAGFVDARVRLDGVTYSLLGTSAANIAAVLAFILTNIPLIGVQDNVNRVFTTPDLFFDFAFTLYVNGQKQLLNTQYTLSESGGLGTGFDTITIIGRAPKPHWDMCCDYSKFIV